MSGPTHYELAQMCLTLHQQAVDKMNRNEEYERQLLTQALVHAVLEVSTQLSTIAYQVEQLP